MCFINISNHPSSQWTDEQILAASEYGQIIDIPFPQITPGITSQEMDMLVDNTINTIQSLHPAAILVQGEYIFTYRLVRNLKLRNFHVYAAQSVRDVVEIHKPDGTYKDVHFHFSGFMEY